MTFKAKSMRMQREVVTIWPNMTITELATALDKTNSWYFSECYFSVLYIFYTTPLCYVISNISCFSDIWKPKSYFSIDFLKKLNWRKFIEKKQEIHPNLILSVQGQKNLKGPQCLQQYPAWRFHRRQLALAVTSNNKTTIVWKPLENKSCTSCVNYVGGW